jgi:hypothetical protein
MSKSQEYLFQAMRLMPTPAGTGAVTHPEILRSWSEHLVKAGVVHVDYLRDVLADKDGNIHVNKLPKPSIKFQEAFRGPHHQYNNAARWVPEGTPDPEPMKLQDVRDLTTQEQHVMAEQLRQTGVIPPREVPQHKAQALDDGGSR